MLRDWIDDGTNDNVIQKRLLGESTLDYTKATMAVEMAELSMKEQKGKKDGQVNDELPKQVHGRGRV